MTSSMDNYEIDLSTPWTDEKTKEHLRWLNHIVQSRVTKRKTLIYPGAGFDFEFLNSLPDYDKYICYDSLPSVSHYDKDTPGYEHTKDKESFLKKLKSNFGDYVEESPRCLHFPRDNIYYHFDTSCDEVKDSLPKGDILLKGFGPESWKSVIVKEQRTVYLDCGTVLTIGCKITPMCFCNEERLEYYGMCYWEGLDEDDDSDEEDDSDDSDEDCELTFLEEVSDCYIELDVSDKSNMDDMFRKVLNALYPESNITDVDSEMEIGRRVSFTVDSVKHVLRTLSYWPKDDGKIMCLQYSISVDSYKVTKCP